MNFFEFQGTKKISKVLDTTVLPCICSCSHCLSWRLIHKDEWKWDTQRKYISSALTWEKFTALYKHLPLATISHPAPSSLVVPPATWSIPTGKSVEKTLSRQTLLKTEMVKWEWESLHTGWEFLPACKVRTTEDNNSALILQSIFNV